MNDLPAYKYTPLASPHHIRLLTLKPGRPGTIVECSLSQTSINASELDIQYEALSYTWGSDARQCPMLLDGVLKPVWDNLASALTHLRQKDRDIILWIDALCINQGVNPESLAERSRQVLRMGEIFRQAKGVVVWLGDESNQSDLAMNLVQSLNDSEFVDTFLEVLGSGGQQVVEHAKSWRAIASLVERAWFTRRWVIQEIAFAASVRVLCGSRQCTWSELSVAISFLQKHGYDIWLVWQSRVDREDPELKVHRGFGDLTAKAAARLLVASEDVISSDSENKKTVRLHNLDTLIWLFPDFQVSDRRDMIYALIPLAEDCHNSPEWTPDYAQDFEEISVLCMTYMMRKSNCIDAICRPWAPLPSSRSWIPALAKQYLPSGGMIRPGRKHSNMLVGAPGDYQHRASGFSQPSWQQNGQFFRVEGFQLDVIGIIGSTDTKGDVPLDWRNLMSEHCTKRQAKLTSREEGRVPIEVCHTLMCQKGDLNIPMDDELRRACDRYLGSAFNPSAVSDVKDESEDLERFLERVRQCIRYRKLAITRSGRLGIVRSKVRPDDVVAILFGCSVPVLLRKHDEQFVLMGKAYIYGVMNGEAMSDLERGHFKARTFVLK